MRSAPKFSVVIPTYNRAHELSSCLHSLLAQTVSAEEFEIIVVDDGSTDATDRLLDTLQALYPGRILRVHHAMNRGCAYARNRGVEKARGEIVLFTDDDCIVPTNWIATHDDAHRRYPEAVGVGGWYWPNNATQCPYHQFYEELFNASYPSMKDVEVETNTMASPAGNTANMSYKKARIDTEGWFDEHINFTGGVDWELKARLVVKGYSLVSIPMSVAHSKTFTLLSFIAKSVRQGRGHDYRYLKFGCPWHARIPRPITLRRIVTQWSDWNASGREKDARIYVLWMLSCLLGKYMNRFARFKPIKIVADTYMGSRWMRRFAHSISMTEKIVCRFDFPRQRGDEMSPRQNQAAYPSCLFSIVIPSYNRGECITAVVHAALKQDLPTEQFEIIVVDDGSVDNTEERLAVLQEQYPERITCVKQQNRGPAAARNRGITESRGDIIVFLDSDCIVDASWLPMHAAVYAQHPDVVAVGGGQRSGWGDRTMFDMYRNSFSLNSYGLVKPGWLFKTNDIITSVVPYDTANISYQKKILVECGGFDEEFTLPAHEDVELAYRVQKRGYTMAVIPSYIVSVQKMRLREFLLFAWRRGRDFSLLQSKLDPIPLLYQRTPTVTASICSLVDWILAPFNSYNFVNALFVVGKSKGFYDARAVTGQKEQKV